MKRHRALGALTATVVVALSGTVFAGASWGANTPRGASWGAVGSSSAVSAHGRHVSVVVRARIGQVGAVEAAAVGLGGTVDRRLAIINGFSATLPESAVASLRRVPGVATVTANVRLQATSSDYDPVADMGSPYNVTLMSGAQKFWAAGYTGRGIGVALIDSGVAPVDGLTVPGKVVNGADLSFESQAPNLRYLDTFGHGTHMAGIIAGRASGATSGQYAGDSQHLLGMAPDARLISVKVADAHGAADVSQVIAAIGWVVQHRNDGQLNIRVLNLSYGTNSSQDYKVDPLAFAAEVAWRNGIVVVAAAGNAGFAKKGSMTSPASDPYVLAVGAADAKGTLELKDDQVPSFSSSGDTGAGRGSRDPDLVAQGAHIVSLRVPGSYIDQTYDSGSVTDTLFRGSGTSQAAAVVSGAAALVLQQRPGITPDQLKMLLMQNTTQLGARASEQGRGELNLANVLTAPTPVWLNGAVPSSGSGSLDAARGSAKLVMDGITLSGEKDIFGMPFVSAAMAALEAAGSSWSGGIWNGSSWSGSSWSGSSWSGSSWSTAAWAGSSWSGSSWSTVNWCGSSWSGSSWSGSSWSGSSWSTNNWLGGIWADDVWASAAWS